MATAEDLMEQAARSQQQPPHVRQQHWTMSICGWTDYLETCCFSLWCPCLRLGLTVERARLGYTFLQVAMVTGVLFCLSHYLIAMEQKKDAVVGMYVWLFTRLVVCLYLSIRVVIRGKLRTRYGIGGDTCEDIVYHIFCHPCAVTQEAVEVDLEEVGHDTGISIKVWPESTIARPPAGFSNSISSGSNDLPSSQSGNYQRLAQGSDEIQGYGAL